MARFLKMVVRWNYYLLPFMMLTAEPLGLDPLYLVLKAGPKFGFANVFLFLFRGVFLSRLVNELTMVLNALLIVGIMVICSATDFIRRITKKKTKGYRLDPQMVRLYSELQIWNGYINQNFCSLIAPSLIFFGVFLIDLV